MRLQQRCCSGPPSPEGWAAVQDQLARRLVRAHGWRAGASRWRRPRFFSPGGALHVPLECPPKAAVASQCKQSERERAKRKPRSSREPPSVRPPLRSVCYGSRCGEPTLKEKSIQRVASESHHGRPPGAGVIQRAGHKHTPALAYPTARETNNPPIITGESTSTTVIPRGGVVHWGRRQSLPRGGRTGCVGTRGLEEVHDQAGETRPVQVPMRRLPCSSPGRSGRRPQPAGGSPRVPWVSSALNPLP